MQGAYDDIVAATSRAATEQLDAMTELFAAYCANRNAIACGVTSQDCLAVLGGESDLVSTMNCVCDACPSFPRIYEGLDEIYRSNAPATDPSVLQVLCPMIGSLKCVTTKTQCAATINGTLGETFAEFIKIESTCTSGGYSTDFPAVRVSSSCAAACPTVTTAYDYLENVSMDSTDLHANVRSAALMDAFCLHKPAFDCAYAAGSLCSLLLLPTGEFLTAAAPPMNCACTACPTLPRVYENFATDAFASPLPEIYMPVLCPTMETLKCFEASNACSAESYKGFETAAINGWLAYEENCTKGNFRIDFKSVINFALRSSGKVQEMLVILFMAMSSFI